MRGESSVADRCAGCHLVECPLFCCLLGSDEGAVVVDEEASLRSEWEKAGGF